MRCMDSPVWTLTLSLLLQRARDSPAPSKKVVRPQKFTQEEKPKRAGRPVKSEESRPPPKSTPNKRGRKTLGEKMKEQSASKRGRVFEQQEIDDEEEPAEVIVFDL